MVEFKECVTKEDILSTYAIMKQLRTSLADPDIYANIILKLQTTEKYRLVGLFEDSVCVGVVGFRPQVTLFRSGEAELYINDLVVDEAQRGKSFGKELINWIEAETKRVGAKFITLDSGMQRHETHVFYEKQGFTATSKHFTRETMSPFSTLPLNVHFLG